MCITGWEWVWWPDNNRSGNTGQNEECLHLSKCVQFTRIGWVALALYQWFLNVWFQIPPVEIKLLSFCYTMKSFFLSHALQGAQRSCCACASTFPTSYGISTASRMQYLPILSSSCRPLWQTPPLSEMGKPKSPSAHCCLLNLLRLSNPDFPSPCLSFHSLVIDVTMALDTLSLPVLEPLTPGRLLDVTVLALSCLYAGELIKKAPFV